MASGGYYFFAVTKVQYRYFNLVNEYLGQAKEHVFYNKKTKFPALVKIPFEQLSTIADLAVATRENSPKYRCKGKVYFKLYRLIKIIDASWRYTCYSQVFKKETVNRLIVWNGLKYNQLIIRLAAERYNTSVIFMENGLVPGMTTIDPRGVNFGNSVPRDVNFYLNLGSDRNNAEQTFQSHSKYVFVPFQVNTDSQIVSYSPWIKDMYDLFNLVVAAAKSLPEDYKVVFKLHPMCSERYSDLITKASELSNIIFDNETSTCELIKNASAICTVNSTVGIEGLLSEKKVIVLGQAFYNMNGLTQSAQSVDELENLFEKIDSVDVNCKAVSGFKKYLTDSYQVCGNWAEADEAHFASLKERLDQLSYDTA